MKPVILVTGGGGFLGTEVVRQLLEKDYQVRILARNPYPHIQKMGAECRVGDVSTLEDIIKASEGCQAIIHTAAKAGVWGSYQEYYLPNVIGTENVLKACQTNCIEILVHTSSPSVVFNGTDMEGVDESVPYPTHYEAHYPHTKAISEQKVLALAQKGEIRACALRPHLIWGIGDNHLIPRFVQRAARNQIRIVGEGLNLVDTVCVENAALAHLLALEVLLQEPQKASGKAYFISNGEPIRLFEWINRFVTGAGMNPVTRKVPAWLAWTVGSILEGMHKAFMPKKEPRMTRFLADELSTAHWFSLKAAQEDLGYQPIISNEAGFQKVLESTWFQELAQKARGS